MQVFSQANVFWEKFTVWKILEMVSLDNLFETNGKKLTQICGCEQTAAKFWEQGEWEDWIRHQGTRSTRHRCKVSFALRKSRHSLFALRGEFYKLPKKLSDFLIYKLKTPWSASLLAYVLARICFGMVCQVTKPPPHSQHHHLSYYRLAVSHMRNGSQIKIWQVWLPDPTFLLWIWRGLQIFSPNNSSLSIKFTFNTYLEHYSYTQVASKKIFFDN